MNPEPAEVDLFISRKSEDAKRVKRIYHFFKNQGLVVFESDNMLLEQGDPDYPRAIRTALNQTKNFIVFASKADYLYERWIDYEWNYFESLKPIKGDRHAKLIVILTNRVNIKDIPLELQRTQVFYYSRHNSFLRKLVNYINEKGPKYIPPTKEPWWRRWEFLVSMLVLGVVLTTIFIINVINSRNPFSMTFFLKPDTRQLIHPDYPKFNGGKLSVIMGDKEEVREVGAAGEAIFKQIPAGYHNKSVPVKFTGDNWVAGTRYIRLREQVDLYLVPDGSLATVKGIVFEAEHAERPLDSVRVIVGAGDTAFFTDKSGNFNVQLTSRLQQDNYQLFFERKGYKRSGPHLYYPKSGSTSIGLEPLR